MCEDCETLGWWWLLLLLRGWFVLFETAGSLSLFHLWQERKSKRNSGSGRETVRTNAWGTKTSETCKNEERTQVSTTVLKERIANKETKRATQFPLMAIEGQCRKEGTKGEQSNWRNQEFVEHQTFLAWEWTQTITVARGWRGRETAVLDESFPHTLCDLYHFSFSSSVEEVLWKESAMKNIRLLVGSTSSLFSNLISSTLVGYNC